MMCFEYSNRLCSGEAEGGSVVAFRAHLPLLTQCAAGLHESKAATALIAMKHISTASNIVASEELETIRPPILHIPSSIQ